MPTTQMNHGTVAKRTLRKRSLLKTDAVEVSMQDGVIKICVPGIDGSNLSVRPVEHYGRMVLEITAHHSSIKQNPIPSDDDA